MYPVSFLLLVPSCHTVAIYSLGWVSRKHPNTETIFVPLWAANTESLFGKLEPACSQDPFHLSRRTTGEKGVTQREAAGERDQCEYKHTHTHTCRLSNGQQVATPLVAKRILIVCKIMRKWQYYSLGLSPQWNVSWYIYSLNLKS